MRAQVADAPGKEEVADTVESRGLGANLDNMQLQFFMLVYES